MGQGVEGKSLIDKITSTAALAIYVPIYNKEKDLFLSFIMFMNVKFWRKMQLSSRKIWWNGK